MDIELMAPPVFVLKTTRKGEIVDVLKIIEIIIENYPNAKISVEVLV